MIPSGSSTLDGQVCLVTGAAERVGRVIAEHFAAAGARVVVNHWQQDMQAQDVVTGLRDRGHQAVAVEADVADPDSAPGLVAAALAHYGRLDVLIHNASNFVERPFDELTPADFDRSFGVNLRGPVFLSQAAGRAMYRQGGGKILALVGNSYYEAWPDFAAHACAKVGLAKLMQLLAVQYSPLVQANAVCPARILPSVAGQDLHIAAQRGENEQLHPRGVDLVENSAADVASFLALLAVAPAALNGAVIPFDGGKAAL